MALRTLTGSNCETVTTVVVVATSAATFSATFLSNGQSAVSCGSPWLSLQEEHLTADALASDATTTSQNTAYDAYESIDESVMSVVSKRK